MVAIVARQLQAVMPGQVGGELLAQAFVEGEPRCPRGGDVGRHGRQDTGDQTPHAQGAPAAAAVALIAGEALPAEVAALGVTAEALPPASGEPTVGSLVITE